MARLPRVALLIETSRSFGRGVLVGVRRYLTEHGPWSAYLETRALESQGPPWLRGWKGDGILARTGTAALARLLRATSVPVVELRSRRLLPRAPGSASTTAPWASMVATHLLERGFRSFGLLALDTRGLLPRTVRELRRDPAGPRLPLRRPASLRPAPGRPSSAGSSAGCGSLPRPAGVMACTDQLGFWLLDACVRAGIRVPEEVAVVGVENDEALCAMSRPPLSSVALPTERIGYEAARMLDRLMRGRSVPRTRIAIEPLGVVARQSSDVVAIDDPRLAAALRHIREQACAGIGVEDVLRAAPMSRSTLERGFRKVLGRSPHDELLRVRLEGARRLLSETDLKLSAVAQRSGFRHVQRLCERFRSAFGETAGRFRARTRRHP